MAKELEGLEEEEIHIDLLKTNQRNIKCQAMMKYMDTVSRNSPPFTKD